MMYARIQNGMVVDMIVWDGEGWEPPVEDLYVAAPDGVGIGHSFNGESFLPPPGPPEPTFEQRAAMLLAAVDAHLNAAAKAKGYDSIINAALRAALPASPFHAEGLAFGNWMDQVYATCYQVMAQVKNNEIPEPTIGELLQMMPVLDLPL